MLPHELGHALTALAFGASSAEVVVGGEPRWLNLSLGRLSLHVRPLSGWRWMWYGKAPSEFESLTRGKSAAVLAAGPLTTLALVLGYSAAGTSTGGIVRWFFWFLAVGGLWTFAVTALPIRYGRFFGPYAGSVSDGYRIREAQGKT